MQKRMFKFYPDFKMRFSRILNALKLTTPAEGGWILKVYENAGWFGMWKCVYESELYFGMEPWIGRLRKVAEKDETHTTWRAYDARNRLIEEKVFI